MEHTVVRGQLVEQPSETLRRRIKLLSFVYLLNASWMFLLNRARKASSYEWVHLTVSTLIFVLCVPWCGLKASENPGSGILAWFNGIQGCLGVWNVFMFVSLVTFLCTLMTICHTCEPVFLAGNSTCLLDEQRRSHQDTLIVASKDCEHMPPPDIILSGILMLAMALVSFSVAFAGRKTGKAKVLHVITVEAVPPERTSIVAAMPQIPEDL